MFVGSAVWKAAKTSRMNSHFPVFNFEASEWRGRWWTLRRFAASEALRVQLEGRWNWAQLLELPPQLQTVPGHLSRYAGVFLNPRGRRPWWKFALNLGWRSMHNALSNLFFKISFLSTYIKPVLCLMLWFRKRGASVSSCILLVLFLSTSVASPEQNM